MKDYKEQVINELNKIHNEPYKNHICEYCEKGFTDQRNLKNHQSNSCKNNSDQVNYNKIKDLIKNLDAGYMDKIIELAKSAKTINNNPSFSIVNSKDVKVNNIGNLDIDINLTVNNYGDENADISLDMDEISGVLFKTLHLKNEKDIQEALALKINDRFLYTKLDKENIQRDHRILLKKNQKECDRKIVEIDQAILECVESILIDFFQKIHIDEDHPENHNIYIPNGRARLFFVMKEKWMRIGDLKFLEKHTDVYYSYLLDAIEFLIDDTHDLNKKQKYIDGKEKIESFYQNEENKTRLEKSMAKKVFDILYQNKDILKKTFDNTKFQGKLGIPLRK